MVARSETVPDTTKAVLVELGELTDDSVLTCVTREHHKRMAPPGTTFVLNQLYTNSPLEEIIAGVGSGDAHTQELGLRARTLLSVSASTTTSNTDRLLLHELLTDITIQLVIHQFSQADDNVRAVLLTLMARHLPESCDALYVSGLVPLADDVVFCAAADGLNPGLCSLAANPDEVAAQLYAHTLRTVGEYDDVDVAWVCCYDYDIDVRDVLWAVLRETDNPTWLQRISDTISIEQLGAQHLEIIDALSSQFHGNFGELIAVTRALALTSTNDGVLGGRWRKAAHGPVDDFGQCLERLLHNGDVGLALCDYAYFRGLGRGQDSLVAAVLSSQNSLSDAVHKSARTLTRSLLRATYMARHDGDDSLWPHDMSRHVVRARAQKAQIRERTREIAALQEVASRTASTTIAKVVDATSNATFYDRQAASIIACLASSEHTDSTTAQKLLHYMAPQDVHAALQARRRGSSEDHLRLSVACALDAGTQAGTIVDSESIVAALEQALKGDNLYRSVVWALLGDTRIPTDRFIELSWTSIYQYLDAPGVSEKVLSCAASMLGNNIPAWQRFEQLAQQFARRPAFIDMTNLTSYADETTSLRGLLDRVIADQTKDTP